MRHGRIVALVAGFILDAVLGDPRDWPHIVRLVGKQIEFEENLVRRAILDDDEALENLPVSRAQVERIGGAAIAADVLMLSPLAVLAGLRLCRNASPVLAVAAEAAIFYQLLAARSLRDESMAVYRRLEAGDLDGARESVSMIVGRDTENLDESGIARATVETVAENASDGVIAPMMYMAVGGAPLAMLYKAANTLDSMMGYKNERYMNMGWAAAKVDDVVNVVPARATGVLMCIAAGLLKMDSARAWRVFRRDRRNHPSPNSAHSEAACAGALGVQLGGSSTYFGSVVEKPTIGDDVRPVEPDDIPRANKLMYATAVLGLGLSVAIGLLPRGSRLRKR